MFGRVVACGIAVFCLVSPANWSGETDLFIAAPAVAVAIVPADGQAQEQLTVQAQDQTKVLVQENEQQSEQTNAKDQEPDQAQQHLQAPVQLAALEPVEPTIASPPPAAPALPSIGANEPFGLNTVPIESGPLMAKWNGVEADIRAENDVLKRCRASADTCPPAARNFLGIVAQGRTRTGRARIGVINRAVNLAIRPMTDLAQWGVPDRWSAPLDTLTTGLGDCEDYAIAKYVALTEAGIAPQDVRLVIVRNAGGNEEHAVVAVRLDGNWIVLDNRWLRMVADNEMSGAAAPLFVLDGNGVRIFAPELSARRAAASKTSAATPGSVAF